MSLVEVQKRRVLPEEGPYRWKFWGAESDIAHAREMLESMTGLKRRMRRARDPKWESSILICDQLIESYEQEILSAEAELKNTIAQHFDWLRRREVKNVE